MTSCRVLGAGPCLAIRAELLSRVILRPRTEKLLLLRRSSIGVRSMSKMYSRRIFRGALRVQACKAGCRRNYSAETSDLHARLTKELTARKPRPIYDNLTPTHSSFLSIALQPFLPSEWTLPPTFLPVLPQSTFNRSLPPAHHLAYFNPAIATFCMDCKS